VSRFIYILLFLLHSLSVIAHENWSDYPEHIHDCLEVLNYHMGDEKKFAELLAVGDIGTTSCNITIMFKNEEQRRRFETARIEKGLNPSFVLYADKKIEFEISYGTTVQH